MFHRPENCQSDAHKFLFYRHIFMHHGINLHKIGIINDSPPSAFVIFECKPGTGKHFVT